MEISIDAFTRDPDHVKSTLAKPLGFGSFFADRMFRADYTEGRGWHDAKITPFAPFSMSPAAAVFHYGQAVFEGMKAYARKDGEILLFRPEMNAQRMAASCARMAMPAFPEEDFLQGLNALVDAERDWVPTGDNQSLYIRPFMIASEPLQGVRPSHEYIFSIILSPVASYYADGFNPVRIFVTEKYVRAVEGGTGEAKAAGNYAASLIASKDAKEAGCAQVLWLDAKERRYIEEIGAMNVLFCIDGKLVTPPLAGSVLPSITRKTLLELAKADGVEIDERPIAIDELIDAISAGRCTEAFGCGTAAVITAIGELVFRGETIKLPQSPGPLAQRYFEKITDLQWGRTQDTRGWSRVVPRA